MYMPTPLLPKVVLGAVHLPLVVNGDVNLAIDFVEARTPLGEVAVDRKPSAAAEIDALTESCAAVGGAGANAAEALATRIEITPGAEVEGEHADGRADTAVDVDFRRRAVRERDALAGEADIKLHVLGEVVARLEVSGDRRLVVGLGDAAEHVVVHDRAAEGEIPGIERRRGRRLDGLDGHVRGEHGTRSPRSHCKHCCG
jgi:hypothetical protein